MLLLFLLDFLLNSLSHSPADTDVDVFIQKCSQTVADVVQLFVIDNTRDNVFLIFS